MEKENNETTTATKTDQSVPAKGEARYKKASKKRSNEKKAGKKRNARLLSRYWIKEKNPSAVAEGTQIKVSEDVHRRGKKTLNPDISQFRGALNKEKTNFVRAVYVVSKSCLGRSRRRD